MTPQQRAWIIGESRRRGVDISRVIQEMFQDADAAAAHRAVDHQRALPSPRVHAAVDAEPVNGTAVHPDVPTSADPPSDVQISTLSELMDRARDYGLELVHPSDAPRAPVVEQARVPAAVEAAGSQTLPGAPSTVPRAAAEVAAAPARPKAVPPRRVVPVQDPSAAAAPATAVAVDPSPDLPAAVAGPPLAATVAEDPDGARSVVLSGSAVSTESGVLMLLPGMGKDGGVGVVRVPIASYMQRGSDSSRLADLARGLSAPVQYLLTGFVALVLVAGIVLAGFQIAAGRYTFEEVQVAPGRSVFYKVDRWTGDMVRCDTTSRVVGSAPLC